MLDGDQGKPGSIFLNKTKANTTKANSRKWWLNNQQAKTLSCREKNARIVIAPMAPGPNVNLIYSIIIFLNRTPDSPCR